MKNRVSVMKNICRLLVLCLLLSVFTASAETSAEVSDLIRQAQAALEASDYETAVPLLQAAADAGNDQAQLWLGNCYDAGAGVEQNAEEAVRYYRLAADQGFPVALFAVGDCCYLGTGVEKDPEAAREWYQKSLNAGYEPDEEDQKHMADVMGKE